MDKARHLLRARSFAPALVLSAGLLIANVIALPAFAAPGSWAGDLRLFAPLALVAMASTPAVMVGGGGLDLSVGPLATLVNVVLVVKLLPTGLGQPESAIPILLALGAGVGLVNGVLVAVLRYQPVIATLCTFLALDGVVLQLAPQPVTPGPNWTASLGQTIGAVPGPLLLIAVPVAAWALLRRTPFIALLLAVGGSDTACYSAGVNVTAVRVLAYVLDGIFAAVAGIALTVLVQAADATLVTQYTLVAIAAVVLGGTPLGGGRGGIAGSLLGAAVLYLLQNLLTEVHVPSTWLQVAYGAVLIGGIVLSARATSGPGRSEPVSSAGRAR